MDKATETRLWQTIQELKNKVAKLESVESFDDSVNGVTLARLDTKYGWIEKRIKTLEDARTRQRILNENFTVQISDKATAHVDKQFPSFWDIFKK